MADESYQAFVDKFKPKLTTDDCYTPPVVYEAVADYVHDRYGIARAAMLRPFYPGGDYKRVAYTEGCCVVDNPPFSIISEIRRWYMDNGVRYFLFAPYLTIFSGSQCGDTVLPIDSNVTYENGAVVSTGFVTSMEPGIIARSDPKLFEIVKAANEENMRERVKTLPKYKYPAHVLTAAMLGYMSKHGIEYSVARGQGVFIRALDTQRAHKKVIYGNGLLLSDTAAAEKAAAEKAAAEKAAATEWELSARELEIVRGMDK